MTRRALVVIAVLAALASVQAVINVMIPIHPRNDIARDLSRHLLTEQDHKAADIGSSSHQSRSSSRSGLPSAVARSIVDQIDRSELTSLPVPYTKKFYLTFGPYYVENPLPIKDQTMLR